jgi:hypothetical protein
MSQIPTEKQEAVSEPAKQKAKRNMLLVFLPLIIIALAILLLVILTKLGI